MVGFVGRLRKPMPPIVLGSPRKDGVVPSQPNQSSVRTTPPVIRNFSYPTGIACGYRPPTPNTGKEPSTWDQLGELCTFSPSASRTGRTRTAGLEDPFFYTSECASYSRLADYGESNPEDSKTSIDTAWSPEPAVPGKRQRRSTLTGLTEKAGAKGKALKPPRVSSIGDHIFAQTTHLTAKLKRNSLGKHRASSSFDASQLLFLSSDGSDRPVSSSGVPLIDTKLTRSSISNSNVTASAQDFSIHSDDSTYSAYSLTPSLAQDTQMAPGRPADGLHALRSADANFDDDPACQQGPGGGPDNAKRKAKEGKPRWLSQLKDWVSVSEPSSQALKDYKKQTYKKAGIALDDPRANAKLHLPIGTLPAEAIKPGGRGLDPEEVALQKATHRKKARDSLCTTSTSQSSYYSESHYSSSSSIGMRHSS
ncbi:hypothetical protein F5Y18DRAFT_438551 [Xylariaceae sp. FL1019]|nr:hypothetical protein F5Y18DRAFT_438551 [Xylariaceae sp. FL1019]